LGYYWSRIYVQGNATECSKTLYRQLLAKDLYKVFRRRLEWGFQRSNLRMEGIKLIIRGVEFKCKITTQGDTTH